MPFDLSVVASIEEVNAEAGMFLADPDLDSFVSSGLYTAMYIKRYVQPHLQQYTERECIQLCRYPGDELDTYKKEIVGAAM